MTATATLMTVEQFAKLPDEERGRYELVRGELIPVASGTFRHSETRDDLGFRMKSFLQSHPLGKVVLEMDCVTVEDTTRRPDISFIAAERVPGIDPDANYLPFAPDIAIEVVSRSEKFIELEAKIAEYLSSGSQEVWVLDDRNRRIHVRGHSFTRLLRPGDRLETELLPGFSVLVEDVLTPR